MKNILIPTDFSENSWNAIAYAVQFFSKSSCTFYLLNVNTSGNPEGVNAVPVSDVSGTVSVLETPSKVQLKNLLLKIKNTFPNNLKHKFFSVEDNNSILDAVRKQVVEKKINLIVMSTKGGSRLKSCVGNTTGNIITKVKCTTLVVPEKATYTPPKDIVFPTDFSIFYQIEVLQPVIEIIEKNNSAVHVLHVNKSGAALNEDQQKNRSYLDDYFSDYDHSFEFFTNKYLDDALQQFINSRNINLITMLAKNLNYFQKLLFNPTAKEITYYNEVPFLVLH